VNFLERRKIEKICNNWNYKCDFIKDSNNFIVYGKEDKYTKLKYVSELLILDLKELNYYISEVFYSNKLEVIFTKNR